MRTTGTTSGDVARSEILEPLTARGSKTTLEAAGSEDEVVCGPPLGRNFASEPAAGQVPDGGCDPPPPGRNRLPHHRGPRRRGPGLLPVDRTTDEFVEGHCDDALDRALHNLETAIEDAGAEVVRSPLPTVEGDATLLAALFQKLVGNAIKFRSDAASRVEVGAELVDGEWAFRVADNGIGIDAAYAGLPLPAGRVRDAPRPGLILLDLNLPRVDGREVLARIKAEEELRRIPVVVLTSSEAEEDILRSYDLPANAYVTKPVDFEAFVKVVRQVDEFYVNVVRLPPR